LSGGPSLRLPKQPLNGVGAEPAWRAARYGVAPLRDAISASKSAARLRISAIVDACFRLIVDGETVSPWRRWGSAQELVLL